MPAYQVEIGPLGQSRRPLVAPLAGALLVLAAAAAGAVLTRDATRHAPATAIASPPADAAADAAADATPDPAPAIISRRAVVTCDGMRPLECQRAIVAARLAIGRGPFQVEAAGARPSLICGDDLDCPRRLLAASDPVGSVSLTLSDSAVVWVNVFRVPAPNRLNENREVYEGRVIRWFHGPS